MTEKEVQVQKHESQAPEVARENRPVYMPPTDIVERKEAFVVVADMPGVSDKAVEVHLEDNVLTVRGSTDGQEPQGFDTLLRGYEPGVFERSFTLRADINRDKIEAHIRNGVLTVVLPKAEHAQPRRITVKG